MSRSNTARKPKTSSKAPTPAEPPKYVADQAYHRANARYAIHSTRRGFTSQEVAHDEDLDDIANDPKKVADLSLTYKIVEILEQHYPAHPWMVQVSHAKGVAMIKLPILMRATDQYVLHISALATANDLVRLVKKAGGELLEMHKMPRAGFSLTPFLEARQTAQDRRRRLLTPDPKKILSKLRDDGAPRIVVPEFESSRRVTA